MSIGQKRKIIAGVWPYCTAWLVKPAPGLGNSFQSVDQMEETVKKNKNKNGIIMFSVINFTGKEYVTVTTSVQSPGKIFITFTDQTGPTTIEKSNYIR